MTGRSTTLAILSVLLLVTLLPTAFAATYLQAHNQVLGTPGVDTSMRGIRITMGPQTLNLTHISYGAGNSTRCYVWDANVTNALIVNATMTGNACTTNVEFIGNNTYYLLYGSDGDTSDDLFGDVTGSNPVADTKLTWDNGIYCNDPSVCTSPIVDNFFRGTLTATFTDGNSSSGNTPPTMISASVALTADNQTLIITGRADDIENATITYTYEVLNNGASAGNVTTGDKPSGVSTNFANVSLSSTPGNYSVHVFASDGVNNSNTVSSNTVTATFPGGPSPPSADHSAALTFIISMGALIIFALAFLPKSDDSEVKRLAYLVFGVMLVFMALIAFIAMIS